MVSHYYYISNIYLPSLAQLLPNPPLSMLCLYLLGLYLFTYHKAVLILTRARLHYYYTSQQSGSQLSISLFSLLSYPTPQFPSSFPFSSSSLTQSLITR